MHIMKDYSKDLHLAKKICKELLAKNKDAIIELYKLYHTLFIKMAWKRLYNKKENYVKSVVSKFWIELLNPKTICRYKTMASLKTYLAKAFEKRIIDNNRAFNRSKKHNGNNLKCELTNDLSIQSMEDDLIQKEQLRLLQEAILMLELNFPHDADLIRMYKGGLNYRQMAEKKLNDQNKDEDKLIKLTNAIKKQFTRKKTGTMVKFKICLNRCLERHGLDSEDIMN